MRQKRTLGITVYRNVVESYNTAPHKGFGGIAPYQVNKTNTADMWAHIYLANPRKPTSKPVIKLKKVICSSEFHHKTLSTRLPRVSVVQF